MLTNETEGQTILRRAKEAMQAANQKASDDGARWLTQKPRQARQGKVRDLFMQEERREAARLRSAYDHCTK